MSTDVTIPTLEDVHSMVGGGELDPQEAMAAALAKIAARNGGTRKIFLNFDTKSGILSHKNGDKRVVIGEDTKFGVNVFGVKQVLTCWKDGKPVDKIEFSFHEDLPDIHTLDMHGIDEEACAKDDECRDGWSDSLTVPMKNMETGEEYEFQAPNKTTKNGIGNLMAAIGKEIALHDPVAEFPVILVDQSTYKSAQGYTVYAPKFEIVDWGNNTADGKPASKALPKKKK